MERMGVSRGDILQQIVLIHIECIQMVVGYLDIFVFEEFCFTVGPVVDGIDGAFNGYARVIVAYEVYCCKYFEGKCRFKTRD